MRRQIILKHGLLLSIISPTIPTQCVNTLLHPVQNQTETACSSETSVNFYQTTWCHIPEDYILQSDVDCFLRVFSRSDYSQFTSAEIPTGCSASYMALKLEIL
jgi:hypothetical protein